MTRLFVHIPKTGGMSIRQAHPPGVVLAGRGHQISPEYTRAVEAKMRQRGEHHGLEHCPWRYASDAYRALPAFAVVRNPWARTASRYYFARQVAQQGKPESVHYDADMSFDEFLEERLAWGQEPYYWHRAVRGWYQQSLYVTDKTGSLRCDVLRLEHLAEELRAYMGATLPPRRRNVTAGGRPYRELYTERQVQIVADWYAEDIEFFGFDFDGAARRNTWTTS